jgi:hypothetical protein
MPDRDNLLKIRIFIAAPNDADEERKSLESAIKQLNRPGGLLSQKGVELEVMEWSRFLEPYMNKDKTVDVEKLPLKQWDLFIGILRFHFDISVTTANRTPNGGILQIGAYTREVFDCAHDAWKRTCLPHIMLYRSHRSFSPSHIDKGHLKHIQTFFNRFANNYQQPPLYKILNEPAGFEKIFSADLIARVNKFKNRQLLSRVVKTTRGKIYPVKVPGKKPGQNDIQEMVFLRLDSLLHNPALNNQPLKKTGLLLDNYRDFAAGIIARYKGFQIYGAVDGSIWAFWGDKAPDRAVSAGIQLVKNHDKFHAGKKLKPRLAAHSAAIDTGSPDEWSYRRFTNYVTHLEKYHTRSGAFAVTDILYKRLDDNLKKNLKYERDYEKDALYSYTGPYGKEPVSNAELENIEIKIEDYIAVLVENIEMSAASPDVAPDPADLRRYVGRIYKSYEYLYRRASDYDENWPGEYFKNLQKFIQSVLNKDKNLAGELEKLPLKIKQKGAPNPTLLSIRDFVGSYRINPIANLDLLLRQLKKIPGEEIDIDTILEEYMREKIKDFVEADDFHEETVFAEIFLNIPLKQKLKNFVQTQHDDPLHERLISRLRKLADFVRIEDRHASQEQRFFPILARDRKIGNFFNAIEQLLAADWNPGQNSLENLFAKHGIDPGNAVDTDVVKKCILIDHPYPGIREYVLNNIPFEKLWDIIAYAKTPLETIKEIAEHFSRLKKDEGRMKVMFDLTLLRLLNDLFDSKAAGSLPQIKAIIEIFYEFDFFIETGYFRRLNDLSMRFKETAGGAELGILEESMAKLEKEYTTRSISTKPPQCLKELPRAVQRKLSRDGHYPGFFCTSTDNLIANEVERYVNHNNIAQFVSISAINGVLFKKLLRKDELFQRSSIINAALYNPKCNLDFARRHASKLSRAERERLASNYNVNPEIRNFIRNKLRTG